MGDLSSPKRREVFDRLRRRYEFYRRHQNGSLRRFENTINGLYEQQRQDTVLLHQRWLESRAKKTSKQSKASKDTSSGHGGDPRNLVVTQRLKKKIDNSQVENPHPPLDTSAFDFDDSDTAGTTTKKTVNSGGPQGVDVSVHIVQQISGNTHPDQKIQTNVNVSTTVKTHYSSGAAPPEQQQGSGAPQASTNVETSTSVECKQEPGDDIHCEGSNQSDSSHNSSDILNQAELDDILNTIDNNGDSEISDELIEELKKFDQIYSKVLQEDSNDSEDKMFGMTSTSPVLQKGAGSYPDTAPSGYDANQNLNPVRTPPMPPNYRSSMSETGPAAETLKQMAAQHQSQQHDGYNMKTLDDTFSQANAAAYRQNGYPSNMNHQHFLSQQSGYMGQHGINNMRSAPVQYGQGKPDMSLTYGATKPLSHYSNSQSTPQQPPPSSLQQLQNQVQAHFNQGAQMEITQTQHMQVSDGPHRMQMSQTQQLQMRQPHQVAMSQQQSFSMPGGAMAQNQSQYMNEQLNMEMMEKMRKQQAQQQQQQQQHPNQQHPAQQHAQHQQQQRSQQQQQQTMMDRQQAAQMQQYMNRPPPEYKMQQSNQGAPESYTANGVGPNPLQTMQNMVNQTNTMQSAGYGQIKTENMQSAGYGQIKSENSSVQMHNGMMQSAQMSTLQRMNSAGPAVGMPGPVSASQAGTATYQGQSLQRQQSYPGTQISDQETRQQRPTGPTYTSAIMRNQRPPNVNVGPDGLNISQPRTQHEWPRQMVPAQGQRYTGPHPGGPASMNRPQMSAASMMQYGSYTNQCGTMNSVAGMQMQRQTRPMQMGAMHSQQAAMMQGNVQAQQMMMQQNMQMSQRMNIRGPMPGASGTMAPSMDANTPSYNAPPGGSHGHPDDFINLLDTAQTGNSDFIDGITVQSSDGNNDANWLDEILGAK